MLKQIAWNTFKNTGDINTLMELLEVDKAIKNAKENNKLINDLNTIKQDNENRKMEKWEL